MKKLLLSLTLLLSFFAGLAQPDSYIALTKEAKIFDQPNNKSYPTTNQNGDTVILSPGMVFPLTSNEKGWCLIQYTPGLQGYIFSPLTATPSILGTPKAGIYKTANSQETVTVSNEGSNWTISNGSKTFKGALNDNIVVFKNEFSNIVYSLVVLDNVPIVFNYDNSLTKFL